MLRIHAENLNEINWGLLVYFDFVYDYILGCFLKGL